MNRVRSLLITLWLHVKCAASADVRNSYLEAYAKNEAIDLLYKLHYDQVCEFTATAHYGQGQMLQSMGLDDEPELTYAEYLGQLGDAIGRLENAIEYLTNETKYWSKHWDFFHGRPKNDPDLGESVPM
jgi:hypothetical protein